MAHELIPAALFAAMIATPAMPCTDWKAVAAFDAINNANDTRELATPHNKDDTVTVTVCPPPHARRRR
jgi:hypothetical protein